MLVTYGFRPEEIPDEVEEDIDLHVPALHTWMIVCTEHQGDPRGDALYTSVTLMDDDVQRLPSESLANLLDCQRRVAVLDLRDLGCEHDVPEIELPVRAG